MPKLYLVRRKPQDYNEVATKTLINRYNIIECYKECLTVRRDDYAYNTQLYLDHESIIGNDLLLAEGRNCEGVLAMFLAFQAIHAS